MVSAAERRNRRRRRQRQKHPNSSSPSATCGADGRTFSCPAVSHIWNFTVFSPTRITLDKKAALTHSRDTHTHQSWNVVPRQPTNRRHADVRRGGKSTREGRRHMPRPTSPRAVADARGCDHAATTRGRGATPTRSAGDRGHAPNRGLGVAVELVRHEPQHDAGLADARLTQQHDLHLPRDFGGHSAHAAGCRTQDQLRAPSPNGKSCHATRL